MPRGQRQTPPGSAKARLSGTLALARQKIAKNIKMRGNRIFPAPLRMATTYRMWDKSAQQLWVWLACWSDCHPDYTNLLYRGSYVNQTRTTPPYFYAKTAAQMYPTSLDCHTLRQSSFSPDRRIAGSLCYSRPYGVEGSNTTGLLRFVPKMNPYPASRYCKKAP